MYFTRTLKSLVLIVCFSGAGQAQAEIAEILKLAPRPELPLGEQLEWNAKTQAALTEAARELARSYLTGQLSGQEVSAEIASVINSRESLEPLIAAELFNMTMQKFKDSQSPSLKVIMDTISKMNGQIAFSIFSKELPGTSRKAQINRSTLVIQASLERIHYTEWPVIFLHELMHRLDSRYNDAIVEFSSAENFNRMLNILNSNSDKTTLSEEDHEFLKKQIRAGLDRGLMAEVRAWARTSEIYIEWREQGEVAAILWMDDILSESYTDEASEQFWFRFLNPRFTSPTGKVKWMTPLWDNIYLEVMTGI